MIINTDFAITFNFNKTLNFVHRQVFSHTQEGVDEVSQVDLGEYWSSSGKLHLSKQYLF